MSNSTALSMSVLSIFEMQLINDALFFKAIFLLYASSWSATVIVPLTTTYASL